MGRRRRRRRRGRRRRRRRRQWRRRRRRRREWGRRGRGGQGVGAARASRAWVWLAHLHRRRASQAPVAVPLQRPLDLAAAREGSELLRDDERILERLAAALAEVGHHRVDGVPEQRDAALVPRLEHLQGRPSKVVRSGRGKVMGSGTRGLKSTEGGRSYKSRCSISCSCVARRMSWISGDHPSNRVCRYGEEPSGFSSLAFTHGSDGRSGGGLAEVWQRAGLPLSCPGRERESRDLAGGRPEIER